MVQKNYIEQIFSCMSPCNASDHDDKNLKQPSDKPPASAAPTLPPVPVAISEKSSSEDYEPYLYGKQHNPTIFWGPVFHLLKYIVGAGVLTLPYTFKSVGYAVGIFGILFVGCLYAHVLHILLDVEYQLCKKLKTPSLTFAGIVQHTFEQGPQCTRRFVPVAKFLVYFHYVFNKSLMNGVYLITISANFKIIVDHYIGKDTNIVTIMTVLLVPLIGLALIRELKFLVPMSMTTNMFIIINLVLILLIPTDYDGSADLKAVNDITQFPNFFAIALGALECTALSLPMKNDMKDPKKFTTLFGVLNIALLAATILYSSFGVMGYAKYGDHLKPNILFNLSPNQMVSLVILCLHSFAICISFILFVYIGFDTIWNNLFSGRKIKYSRTIEYALRVGLCVLPYFIAVVLPDFKIMLSLTNVIGILMDQGVPPILHVILLTKQKSKTVHTYLILLKDFVLILICLLLFIGAMADVVNNIVKFYT